MLTPFLSIVSQLITYYGSKTTLKPTYAIELDDYTHDKADRRERDREVERIFKAAELPLVRFRSRDVSEAEIIHALANANKLAG